MTFFTVSIQQECLSNRQTCSRFFFKMGKKDNDPEGAKRVALGIFLQLLRHH